MNRFRAALKPLLAFALGSACSVFCAEIGLRYFGEAFREQASAERGRTNIVCLGNSFTAGVGADPGHSYCDYLQRLLDRDESLAHLRLQVVNLGESSKNTSMILRDLAGVIHRYRPRVALVMAGEPNQWNRLGLSTFIASRGNRLERAFAMATDALYQIRVYRFVILAWRDFAQRTEARRFSHVAPDNKANLGYRWLGFLYEPNVPLPKPLSVEEQAEATESLLTIAETAPEPNLAIPLVLARSFAHSSPAEALKWYERSIAYASRLGVFPFEVELDLEFWRTRWPSEATNKLASKLSRLPRSPESARLRELAKQISYGNLPALLPLVGTKRKDSEETAKSLVTLLRSYPAYNGLRRHLYIFYRDRGQPETANSLILEGAFANPLTPLDVYVGMLTEARAGTALAGQEFEKTMHRLGELFPDEAHNFQIADRESVRAWTTRDLTRISVELREAGVKVVWQTYPPLRQGDPQWVDPLIREVATQQSDPLVDTYEYLQKHFGRGPGRARFYSDQFGARDPHLSNLGNERLAQRIFERTKEILTLPK